MHLLLHSAIDVAEPIRRRLAARLAAFDAKAFGQAGLRLAERQAAALGAGIMFRLRVADALAEMMTRGSLVAEAADTEWVEVNRPFPAFALAMPEFDEQRYAIWRHADGGGRKDVIAFGDLGSSGATAMIELYRGGGEPAVSDTDITASIGQLRLSTRPALPNTIDTKFGEVAVEPFTDSAPSGARQCLRFSRSFEEQRFEIAGWFCNAGEELVDRRIIACAIDRLSLVAAGSEPKLGALFARAELKRTFCGQQSVFVAATPKRNDWIEAARDPRLRGRK